MNTSLIRTTVHSILGHFVRDASAHCDTEDGPAVVDGRRSLETGNINHALKWVHPEGEDEVRAAFAAAIAAQQSGANSDEAAHHFLETLVRVHRAGEGAGFDEIKPTGAHVEPEVVAADQALEIGSIEPLRGLIADDRWEELKRRFDHALSLKNYDTDDLVAAREYIAAYVSFFKYAEDEDEHHHGHAEHGHEHHGHEHHRHEHH